MLIAIGVAVLALIGAAVFVTSRPSKAEAPATLRVLTPAVTVQARPGGPFEVVSKTTTLQQGATIRTDATGEAEIDYFDGSTTRLAPASEFTLQQLVRDGTQKQLVGSMQFGKSWHRVAEVTGSGSRFEVKTSNATAAVRGTAFAVVCVTSEACEVTVIEGGVALVDPKTNQPFVGRDGRPVVLVAGQAITVSQSPDGTTVVSEVHTADLDDPFIAENARTDDVELPFFEVQGTSETAPPTTTTPTSTPPTTCVGGGYPPRPC